MIQWYYKHTARLGMLSAVPSNLWYSPQNIFNILSKFSFVLLLPTTQHYNSSSILYILLSIQMYVNICSAFVHSFGNRSNTVQTVNFLIMKNVSTTAYLYLFSEPVLTIKTTLLPVCTNISVKAALCSCIYAQE
jgi:hypothetical protein